MRTDWGFNGEFKALNDAEGEILVTLVLRLAANLTGNVLITLEVAKEEAIKT